MAHNPDYQSVDVGDTFSSSIQTYGGEAWGYTSIVRKVGQVTTRFGKPDRIVTVTVCSTNGNVIDHAKQLWVSQLLQGLV